MFEFRPQFLARRRSPSAIPTSGDQFASTSRLISEALEDRWLLSSAVEAALQYPTPAIPDPFAYHAVTVESLRARAAEHRYIPGELVVAIEIPGNAAAARGAIDAVNWAEWLGVPGTQLIRRMLTSERELPLARTSVSLVHLDLGPSGDVFAAIESLSSRVDVMWSSPNFIGEDSDPREFLPNDPFYSAQYHHPLMQNEAAWDLTLGDPSIVIGITDDGFDIDHSDLLLNVWQHSAEAVPDGLDNDGNGYIDDLHGWDFIANDNDPRPTTEDNNHGTHVAGIAAGRTDNAVGIAGTAGRARFMPLKFYDDYWTSTIVANAYAYAGDMGVPIVNTSYNVDQWVSDVVYVSGVQYMYDQGVLHFNSAGNNNQANPDRQLFEQSLLVVSTTSTDARSSFSNYGVGMDISSPGSSILSTLPEEYYAYFSGTSMSSPNAAGVAALIWSLHPEWTRDQVAAQLLATADNIDGLNPGFDGLLGAGRTNSYRALTETIGAPTLSLDSVPEGVVSTSDEIRRFVLGYSQVMDTNSAGDPASYELRSAGADELFDTADDQLFSLSFASPYMVGTNYFQLLIGGGPLGIGKYRFTMDAGAIHNPFGTPLDGNGDGVAGDSFVRFFEVTFNAFQPIGPAAGLNEISWNNPGLLASGGAVDEYDIFVEAGHSIAVRVSPLTAGAVMSAEILGLSSPVSAPSPGQSFFLPLARAASSGWYPLHITADQGTGYSFDVFRNINPQGLTESTAPVNLGDSWLELGSGRYAAIGKASGSNGQLEFDWYNSFAQFVDISQSGTPLNLTDDDTINYLSPIGNALFPAGWFSISNNGGVINALNEYLESTNRGLPVGTWERALLPFWDDLDGVWGNIYVEQRQIDGIDALIVQWHNRPHYPSIGDVTFQLQIFASGPVAARFVYPDVYFGHPELDYGRSATVGVQFSTFTAYEFSYNDSILENGDVIDVIYGVVAQDVDDYQLDFTGKVGTSIDVLLNGLGIIDFRDQLVQLLDPSGAVVATASAGASNIELAIQDYVVAQPGIHTIRVTSNVYSQYSLLVTEDLVYDIEPNNVLGPSLRGLDSVAGVLGYLSGGSVTPTRYNDPTKFVDISGTGQIFNPSDDGSATIFSGIGNALFPAGAMSIGNNGGVLAGGFQNLPYSDQPLPVGAFSAALLPFWDDLDDETGLVYFDERIIDGVSALVVQWNNRPHYNNFGNTTFQVQLFATGSIAARFAYEDVLFGAWYYDNGIEATIGVQGIDGSASMFSYHTAAVFDGDVIDFAFVSKDIYGVDLNAGESYAFWTGTPFDHPNYQNPNLLDPKLLILDENGNELALDSDSLDGKNSRLVFSPATTGRYYIEVGNDVGEGQYTLHWSQASVKIAAGNVSNVTDAWTQVSFAESFQDPVVLVNLRSFNDAEPTTVRIRNVTPSSFEVQLREWGYQDGVHAGESISYVVLEHGLTVLDNGRWLLAGRADLGSELSPVVWGANFAATPVVLTTLQSQTSGDPAVVRLTNVSPQGFSARLQEEEAADGVHPTETIHYLATLPGVGASNGLTYEAGWVANVSNKALPRRFQQSYLAAPGVLATMQTYVDDDPATVRLRSLTAKGATWSIEEEQSADAERAHARETVGFLTFRYVPPAGLNGDSASVGHREFPMAGVESSDEPVDSTMRRQAFATARAALPSISGIAGRTYGDASEKREDLAPGNLGDRLPTAALPGHDQRNAADVDFVGETSPRFRWRTSFAAATANPRWYW